MLGILFLIFFILALYAYFFTTSVFTASLGLLKSTVAGTNLSISSLSTLRFKLLKLVYSLSISNLSTLEFKLAKSTFLAKDDVFCMMYSIF